MADINQTLKKLNLYKVNPNLVKDVSPNELADLVILVLKQVAVIETAIKEGRLDAYTPQAGKDYLGKPEALTMLTNAVNDAVRDFDGKMSQRGSQLEIQVLKALENIRSGDNGIVTEAEIQRAAEMAYSLIELPDFTAMISEAITADISAVRDGLEILIGDNRLQLEITDVKGLEESLQQLAQSRTSTGGGGIGKNQVYSFIREAIADGTISISGGGGHTIEDEGTPLTQRTKLNFVGAGVTVTDDAGDDATVVTIPGGSGSGDVVGPASATNNNFAAFDTTTGKLIKDSGSKTSDFATAAQGTKVDFITVTQAVNLDTMESDIAALEQAVVLKGLWDASAGTFPGGGTAQAGFSYIVSVGGTVNGIEFVANDRLVAILDNASTTTYASNWHKLDYTDAVLSVAGRTGAVVLVKADVGLGNADNTTDADKPVSTAQQTALNLKANILTPTFTTNITTPLIIGGTAVGSNLIYKSTTGAGTAAGIAHQFTGGTDGATVAMTLLNNGNVGIGTTNPTQTLDIGAGSMALLPTTSATTGIIFKGANRFIHNFALAGTDGFNTFVGLNAGNFTMTGSTGQQGSYNTGIGANPLQSNTTGSFNIAIGLSALQNNTTGSNNTANGVSSLQNNITGNNNTAVGISALRNTTGNQNTALGLSAGQDITTANHNTLIGWNTGRGITTGANNTILGANVTGLSATLANNIILADGAGNQRLNIDAAGNVGIGTTGPTGKLTVLTTNDTAPSSISAFDARHAAFGPSVSDGVAISKGTGGVGYISSVRPNVAWDPIAIQASTFAFNPSGGTSAFIISAAGNVGIGTNSPTATLHLKAGTATASTAPIKLTSGTLLTTPEVGAIEFLTDAYHATITTGAARRTFAFLESPTFTGAPTLPTGTIATTQSAGNNTTAVATTAFATTALALKANIRGSVNAQTGTTYTLVIGDEYLLGVTMNNAAANTITIPTNASVAFPIGTTILITQLGAGATTIAAAGGVTTVVPAASPLLIGAVGGSRVIQKRGTDSWLII